MACWYPGPGAFFVAVLAVVDQSCLSHNRERWYFDMTARACTLRFLME